MSHFVGVVVGDDYEEQIEKFWELDLAQEDAKNDERAEFECEVAKKDIVKKCIELTDEMTKRDNETLKNTISMLTLVQGKHYKSALKTKWGEDNWRFKNILKQPDEKIKDMAISECKEAIENILKESTSSRYYEALNKKDYEAILSDYYGGGFNDNGDWGHWYNPNAKWDWFSVGGRWRGFFKLKPGAKGELGQDSWSSPKEDMKGKADIAKIKDIDWEGMDKEYYDSAKKRWNAWQEELKKPEKERQHPYFNFGVEKGDTEKTYMDREGHWKPFCIVMNDEWYERGTMGWWGCVSNEKEEDVWDKEWKKLIAELDPETVLTAVDFHI